MTSEKKAKFIEQKDLEDWLLSRREQEDLFLSAPVPVDPDQDQVLNALDNHERRGTKEGKILFSEIEEYPDPYQGYVFDPLPDTLPDWAEEQMQEQVKILIRDFDLCGEEITA